MAVVDYGSIVKGALKSFNEVDQYIKAEEEKEYQIAKERRDNLYKADRDKMADFWRDYQQNYKEHRDKVDDEYRNAQFKESIRQHNDNVAFKNKQLAAQQDKWNKEYNLKQDIFKFDALNDIANIESKVAEKKGQQVYTKVNGSTRSRSGSYLNGVSPKAFIYLYKENKAPIDAIIKNSDSIEQKLIALEDFVSTLPEDQREPAKSYFAYVNGYNEPATVASTKNISNGFKTVVADAVKDGKSATRAEIAQNFVEYANEFLPQDIEQVFKPTIEVMMSGLAKYKENGKDVLIKEFGGYIPNTARFYHIQDSDTVGIIGDFMVNGQVKHIPITNNGQPYALNDGIIASLDRHTLKAQIDNSIKNRPTLLSEKDYNQINKDNPDRNYNNYLLENAMPIQTYNKDPNIVTLKDANAQNFEIKQAIQQSQEKPDTSVVSNLYTDRFNGVEKGDKVYIDDGKIVVPIGKEEEAERQAYESISKEVLSRKLNENDIAEVQQSKNLSREKAKEYLYNKYSNEEFDKYFKNNPELIEKRVKVDAIHKGFQGDFSDNTFDLLTNKLKDDYVYIDENANKVISVAEFNKLPKEEQDKFEKTNISDKEDLDLMKAALSTLPPHMALIFDSFDSHGKEGKEKLDAALRPFVPDEEYRKTFINQYEEYKAERNSLRKSAGGNQGAYLRKFLETKKSVGDKSIPKEKIEEMYRITERYKDLPLNDDDGEANKEKLLSELKDAGLNGTTMYRVIALLKTDEGKSVNSFREKKYSYTKAIKPEKKSQKLSDATSKQRNTNNNGGGGYRSTSTSVGGVIKGNKFESDWDRTDNAIYNMRKFMGLKDLNQ